MSFRTFVDEAKSQRREQAEQFIEQLRASYKEWAPKNLDYFNYKITPKGEIIFNDMTLEIFGDILTESGELPVKIKSCGAVKVYTKSLTSFKNFPDIIDGRGSDIRQRLISTSLDLVVTTEVRTLEGLNKIGVNGSVSFLRAHHLTLHNLHEAFDYITGNLYVEPSYSGPLLSALLVKRLKSVDNAGNSTMGNPLYVRLREAISYINKHLKEGRNVLACQEELIEAGLEEFAEL